MKSALRIGVFLTIGLVKVPAAFADGRGPAECNSSNP